MSSEILKGRVHSFQSLGTVDGPGVRFVAFFQGCHLRCGCCHNPDTWDMAGGKLYTAREVVERAARCRDYFGPDGGITLSGGEPLLQADFACEVFNLCRQQGINTCLDTSGSIINEKVLELLDVTDRVLLDIKYTDPAKYKEHVGCDMGTVMHFLELLAEKGIPTTLRQVIIPGLNDTLEDVSALKDIAAKYPNVDKIELLPFKKMCSMKYDKLGIDFPFANIPEPEKEKMDELNTAIKEYL